MSNDIAKYLSEKEVSGITGIALSTLRNHRSLRKGIPYLKIYRSIKYSLVDVLDFMESHKIRLIDELGRKEGKI
jgi:hypothetical protein